MRSFEKHTVQAIALYCTASPSLTWLNKYLLLSWAQEDVWISKGDGSKHNRLGQFGAKFYNVAWLTTTQLFASFVVLSGVNVLHGRATAERPNGKAATDAFAAAVRATTQTIPISVCFVLQLTLSSLALEQLSVSVYQATRSLSILFSVLANHVCIHSPVSRLAVASCLMCCLGILLAWFDPASRPPNSVSIVCGIAASFMGVAHMSLFSLYARRSAMPAFERIRWVSFGSWALLAPIVLWGSWAELWLPRRVVEATSAATLLWKITPLSAALILAPLLPLSSGYCMEQLTPLGCCMIGAFKSAVQAILGNALFGHPMTPWNVLGLALCIAGCGLYSLSA